VVPGVPQKRYSEYNVKLRFSRHWSNVNACCDVGGVTYKNLLPDDRVKRETQSSDANIQTLTELYIYIYISI
jgi:hypothetical protein